MLIPGRLRSRLIFCVMSLCRRERTGGGQSPPPCTPLARPAHRYAVLDLSLQLRVGRGSVPANTALSPHPCGLPRPSGNVSAILRPPAPAVSVAHVVKITIGRTNRRPDKAFMPPSGTTTGTVPDRRGYQIVTAPSTNSGAACLRAGSRAATSAADSLISDKTAALEAKGIHQQMAAALRLRLLFRLLHQLLPACARASPR